MQANPDKFQSICIGKQTSDYIQSFNIGDTTIPCDSSVKLLGIEIDSMLNFDQHVSTVCKKAARQVNVLARLYRYLDIETRLLIYKCFIRSNFNYCPIVWHFCSQANTEKLEKLQYRALRLVYCDFTSTYTQLLDRVNMPTLHVARLRQIAAEVFKCLQNLSPKYVQELISVKSKHYSYRCSNLLDVPRFNTVTYGKKSFRYEATQVWNNLPNDIRATTDYGEFKSLIRTWSGFKCRCSMCI